MLHTHTHHLAESIHTSHSKHIGILREMVNNAFQWAFAHGKTRRNAVHGQEEARLVLDDWFEAKNEHGQDSSMTATAEIEDTI